MRRLAVFLLVVLAWLPAGEPPAAAASSSGAAAPQDPPAVTPVDLAGRWQVAYEDAELGTVTGKAFIDARGEQADVYFARGAGDRKYHLTSSEIRIEGTHVTIVLDGESPSAGVVRRSDLREGEYLLFPTDASTARVTAEGTTARLPIRERGEPDENHVELDLEFGFDGYLSGTWAYYADPVTRRDGTGRGRVGTYQDLDGEEQLGVQSGSEVWRKVEAQIAGIVVLEDQLHREHPEVPAYTYPRQGQVETRTLFVFGVNLPVEIEDPVELESVEPNLEYFFHRRPADASSPLVKPDFDLGWQKAVESVPEEFRARLRELDALTVRARVRHGVRPGVKRLRLNGAEGTWELQFGDALAEVHFVRPVFAEGGGGAFESGHEDTEDVFVPETVRLEVRIDVAMDLAEVPLILGRNGTVVRWRDRDTWPATPVAGSNRIYRTPPIALVDRAGAAGTAAGGLPVTVADSDLLLAALGETGLLHTRQGSSDPSVGVATVTAAAARSTWDARAKVHRTPDRVGTLWKDALRRAARCREIEIDDWDRLSRAEFDRVSNLIVTEWGVRSISVKLYDVAAMILLADQFEQMMENVLGRVPAISDDPRLRPAQIRAFRDAIKPHIDNPAFPLSRIRIDGPDPFGVDVDYTAAFWEDYFSPFFTRHFGDDVQAAKVWSDNAVVEGLNAYRESLEGALTRAREAGDCKLEELIEITGFSFDPVVRALQPKLMKAGTDASGRIVWVPDREARAAVNGLRTLAEAVKAQEDLSSLDTQVVVAAATIALSVPSMLTNAVWAAALALAADIGDVAFTAISGGAEFLDGQREVAFARGASEILGVGRLADAEARARSLEGVLAETALAGAFAGLSAADTLAKVRYARAADFLTRVDDPARELARLSRTEVERLREFLEHARGAPPSELTRAERAALERIEQLRDSQGVDFAELLGRRLDVEEVTELPMLNRRGRPGERPAARPDAPRPPPEPAPAELVEALPPQLRDRVPVEVDPSLEGGTVRVQYDVDDSGLVTDIRMRVGPDARPVDVELHARTAELMGRYSGLSGRVRELIRRLRAWIGVHGAPPPGSLAWEAQLEIEKLPRVIEERLRRLSRLGQNAPERAQVLADIDYLEQQLESYRRTLDQMDLEAGQGFVAAELRRAREVAVLGYPEPPAGHYFARVGDHYELRASATHSGQRVRFEFDERFPNDPRRGRYLERADEPRDWGTTRESLARDFDEPVSELPELERALSRRRARGDWTETDSGLMRRWAPSIRELADRLGDTKFVDDLVPRPRAGTAGASEGLSRAQYDRFRHELRRRIVDHILEQPVGDQVGLLRQFAATQPESGSVGALFAAYRRARMSASGTETVRRLADADEVSKRLPNGRYADDAVEVAGRLPSPGAPPRGRYLLDDKGGADPFGLTQARDYSSQITGGRLGADDGRQYDGLVYFFQEEDAARRAAAALDANELSDRIFVGYFDAAGRPRWVRRSPPG